jgi:hypothetical protein
MRKKRVAHMVTSIVMCHEERGARSL